MIHQQVARPYARALFTLAQSAGREARVWEDLERVLAVWDGNPAFRAFIRRPEVSKRVKRDVVHRVFASDLDELTRHFLEVLLDKNRETVLGEIASEYRRLWDDARGIRHADVTSAEELGADEKDALTQALARATGHQVHLSLHVDPKLLGGVVIRMGDRVLDGSLARRLALLGERLRSGDGGGSVLEH